MGLNFKDRVGEILFNYYPAGCETMISRIKELVKANPPKSELVESQNDIQQFKNSISELKNLASLSKGDIVDLDMIEFNKRFDAVIAKLNPLI